MTEILARYYPFLFATFGKKGKRLCVEGEISERS